MKQLVLTKALLAVSSLTFVVAVGYVDGGAVKPIDVPVAKSNPGNWDKCAGFIQNLFGDDKSQKSQPMMNLVPVNLQSTCSLTLSSSLNSITMTILETEIIAFLGVFKALIAQWSTPNPTCPCVNSSLDFYARIESACPNLYKLFNIVYDLVVKAWAAFKAKLQGPALQCVTDTCNGFSQKYNGTWTQCSQQFYALPQTNRDDIADACGSLSPTIKDMATLHGIQGWFKLSASASSQTQSGYGSYSSSG